ncbi:MAG: DUF4268 domain-containing protein [Dehalococcoidia bacterium]
MGELASTIGVGLEVESVEQAVGPFSADIVCVTGDGSRVVIENQFGRTDHDHLGKTLTYAGGLQDVRMVIWIAERFTDEHRAALDWLNASTSETNSFWGIEIQLWRIGESPAAPRFNVVVQPNIVTKAARLDSAELSPIRMDRLTFWQGFHDHLQQHGQPFKVSAARPETWVVNTVGRGGVQLNAVYTNIDLDQQAFVSDQLLTRVELVVTGSTAMAYYDQILVHRATLDAAFPPDGLHWYEVAAKERKIFVQRAWQIDADREVMYQWLRETLERLRSLVMPIVPTLKSGAASETGAGAGTDPA